MSRSIIRLGAKHSRYAGLWWSGMGVDYGDYVHWIHQYFWNSHGDAMDHVNRCIDAGTWVNA